jgi:hypothetical protein
VRSFPWILGALLPACALDHASDFPAEAGAPAPRQRARDAQVEAPDAAGLYPREDPQRGTDAALDPDTSRASDAAPDTRRDLPKETCNGQDDDGDGKLDEGCVMRLLLDDDNRPNEIYDTPVQLDGARLIWGHTDDSYQGNLWTAKLPLGTPELLFSHQPPVRASHDGERVVYSDYDQFGFTLLDLRDGSRRLIKPLEPAGYNLMYTAWRGATSPTPRTCATATRTRPSSCTTWRLDRRSSWSPSQRSSGGRASARGSYSGWTIATAITPTSTAWTTATT